MSATERPDRTADDNDARVRGWTPLWRTASRGEAIAILRSSREITHSLIDRVPARRMSEIGPLGGGVWSIKDLIGHLARVEERALVILGARKRPAWWGEQGRTTDELNAFHIARKRSWSLARVRKDAASVASDLHGAIAALTDEGWLEKVDTGNGRSALGLVLGKVLTGDKYGYYAHDLAHYKDLRKATDACCLEKPSQG